MLHFAKQSERGAESVNGTWILWVDHCSECALRGSHEKRRWPFWKGPTLEHSEKRSGPLPLGDFLTDMQSMSQIYASPLFALFLNGTVELSLSYALKWCYGLQLYFISKTTLFYGYKITECQFERRYLLYIFNSLNFLIII